MIRHKNPTVRGTWASHRVNGWNIGTSANHYRCHHVYVTKTRGERDSDCVEFSHIILHSPTILPQKMSSLRRVNYTMPWRTQHPKRHFPPSATTKWSQLSNYPRYFPRRKIMRRKEQTLHSRNMEKIRHCTSESASRSDQTSSLSTAQFNWKWWGEGLYKFSVQGPHVPFRSKHYSPWSTCPTTKGVACATSKGGQGRSKFQLEIKRKENSHSTLCIDITI